LKLDSVVIVTLVSPKQSFFGRLVNLSAAGVTVRGIDLDAFESWMDTIASQDEGGIEPSTTFFPMYRVERMDLDEGIGGALSLSSTFLGRVGSNVKEHLR
jgi:hypothetical protein